MERLSSVYILKNHLIPICLEADRDEKALQILQILSWLSNSGKRSLHRDQRGELYLLCFVFFIASAPPTRIVEPCTTSQSVAMPTSKTNGDHYLPLVTWVLT